MPDTLLENELRLKHQTIFLWVRQIELEKSEIKDSHMVVVSDIQALSCEYPCSELNPLVVSRSKMSTGLPPYLVFIIGCACMSKCEFGLK